MASSKDELRFLFWRQRQVEQRIRQLQQRQVPPRRKRRESGFPFNLLERAVRWVLFRLEQAVSNLVAAALNRVRKP